MEEIHKVMQQKLGKTMEALRLDMEKEFPDEDPEILLVNYICDRYGFKRPKHPQTELKAQAKRKGKNVFGGPALQKKGTTMALGAIGDGEELDEKHRSPMPTPKVKLNTERLLEEKLNSPRDYASLQASDTVHWSVENDAWRFEESKECIQNGQERVAGTIAKLRAELRGKFIGRIPLLASSVLSDMDRYWLVGKLRPQNFSKGDVIVSEGDPGDKLYIIERGLCDVFMNGVKRRTMEREDFFGEMSVIYDLPRSATVMAGTDVTLLSLSRDDLFSTISPKQVDALAITARTRLFSGVPLLSSLGTRKKESVTARLKQESWPEGVILARQNHLTSGDNRRMYIILDGNCRKQIKKSGYGEAIQEVDEIIGHGAFFNMFALWYNCPCSATITTHTPCTTLSISYDELIAICNAELKSKGGGKGGALPRLSSKMAQPPARESETKRLIRYSMWLHLLKQVFLEVGMEQVASNPQALARVCEQSTEVVFKTWDPVFTKGEQFDTIYILETGALSEHEHDIETLRDAHELGPSGGCTQHTTPGTCFGTECLHGKEKNVPSSTLAASTETSMLAIPGDILRRMLRNGSLC